MKHPNRDALDRGGNKEPRINLDSEPLIRNKDESKISQENMQCDQDITVNQSNADGEIENITHQDLTKDSPKINSDQSGNNKETIINDQIINNHSMEVEEFDQISQQNLTIENENPTKNISDKVQMQIDSDQTQKENRTYKATDNRDLKKQCDSCLEMFSCKSIDLHFDSCKIYFPYMVKLSSPDKGYKCKVCKFIVRKSSGNFSARSKMYAHLKGNHKIDKDQNAKFDNIIDHREKEDKSKQDLIENESILRGFEKTIDPVNNQAKKSWKKNKECKSCKEIITCKNDKQVALHYESCKVYFEHMKKSYNGYDCKACSYKTKGAKKSARSIMYSHLKTKHKIRKNLKTMGKKCELCNDVFNDMMFSNHLKSCKLYSEFIEKSSNGFKCKQCSFKTDSIHARQMIYLHIRKKHQNLTKSDKNIELPQVDLLRNHNGEACLQDNTSSLNNLKPKESRQKTDIVKLNNLPVIQPVETIEKNQCNLQNEIVQGKSTDRVKRTECTHCQEMVYNFNWNKHAELCQEAFKYMDGKTCLICEIEFNAIKDVAKHIKKEHLDIIIVMEKLSEVSPETVVKDEVAHLAEENHCISPALEKHNLRPETLNVKPKMKEDIIILDEENDFISSFIDKNKARPETAKIKSEVKEEIIYLDDLNDCTEIVSNMNGQKWAEPHELTTIYTCPMCYKKYASLSDLESHISLFHRIPKKVQRQSMQGGKSMAIITQSL